jgi:Amidase
MVQRWSTSGAPRVAQFIRWRELTRPDQGQPRRRRPLPARHRAPAGGIGTAPRDSRAAKETTSLFDELDRSDIPEIHSRLLDRDMSSVELTRRCLDRIAALNPALAAVLAVDTTALAQAAASDERHAAGDDLGPLDGIPVLVKDNIDTANLVSTAGSRLLTQPPGRDAEIVTRLRCAGAVIIGKTNLSEWSNFRSTQSTEGWSAVGGQTRNPYRLDRSAWGSSAGSAAAVASGMSPLAIGTESDGSIVGPAGVCGVVGVKPEFGLLPMHGIVPISTSLDTVGPLAYRVRDAATCLAVLAGQPDLANVTAPISGCRLGLWPPRTSPPASGRCSMTCARPWTVPVHRWSTSRWRYRKRLPRTDYSHCMRSFARASKIICERAMARRNHCPRSWN